MKMIAFQTTWKSLPWTLNVCVQIQYHLYLHQCLEICSYLMPRCVPEANATINERAFCDAWPTINAAGRARQAQPYSVSSQAQALEPEHRL